MNGFTMLLGRSWRHPYIRATFRLIVPFPDQAENGRSRENRGGTRNLDTKAFLAFERIGPYCNQLKQAKTAGYGRRVVRNSR